MKIEEFADLGVAAELNNLYAVPAHRFSSAPRIQELSVTISSWISKSEGIRETFTLKAFASSRRELIDKLNSPSGFEKIVTRRIGFHLIRQSSAVPIVCFHSKPIERKKRSSREVRTTNQ